MTNDIRAKVGKALFAHYNIVGPILGILVISSFILASCYGKTMGAWLVALWGVVPPFWFLVELGWARSSLKDDPARLATLKEDQQMAAKIWAGVVAALSVLYLR